jgi:glycosyltransferase involved in cell wall biosynthesis
MSDTSVPPARPRVVVVMPAYNAERTLEKTVRDIPAAAADHIILGDDASRDRTVEIAQRLGLEVIRHDRNRGYGANQKTCYDAALRRGADVVVMIHPDYQYDSRLTPYLVGFIRDGVCDVVLGSRIRTRREALAGGMPIYKYLFNRGLTLIENLVLGQNLGEFHTGFRAFRRQVLETVAYELNSDDFVFDQEILVQAVAHGFRLGDVPVPTRYEADSSSINFRRSVVYGLGTLATLARYVLHRLGLARIRQFLPVRRQG